MATAKAFPVVLCLAATFSIGLGLIASAANVQWGAAPPDPDALQMAWLYVNVAWVWTWLLVWPAIALGGKGCGRLELLFEFFVILVAAVPAVGVAVFLSATPASRFLPTVAMQLAIGLVTLGILAHRRLPAALVAGLLAMFAVVVPIVEYLWAEFFPVGGQSWMRWMPLNTIMAKDVSYEIVGVYAILGIAFFLTAPASISQAGGANSGGAGGLGKSTSSARIST